MNPAARTLKYATEITDADLGQMEKEAKAMLEIVKVLKEQKDPVKRLSILRAAALLTLNKDIFEL